MKSEPDEFSIDDLEKAPRQTTPWFGVRNYQARNFMRDGMKPGDGVLFYHSSCAEPGVVGIAEVASDAYPDPTQFERKSDYYDEKSTREQPRWMLVDVAFKRKLKRTISLNELKEQPRLDGFALLQRGNRLSVLPVTKAQWDAILALE
jgi:predicted RNA-binding protein with PUA-like domain